MKLLGPRTLTPGQGALGLPELVQYLGLSRTSIAKLRKTATPPFPQPINLLEGGRSQWLTTEVDAWLQARAELLRRNS